MTKYTVINPCVDANIIDEQQTRFLGTFNTAIITWSTKIKILLFYIDYSFEKFDFFFFFYIRE